MKSKDWPGSKKIIKEPYIHHVKSIPGNIISTIKEDQHFMTEIEDDTV